MNLGQFLGLPMMAGPRDIPMGEDELGNILYAAGGTPSGQRYTKKTAPANRASVVKALVNGAKAKPWETVGNLVTGAAQGAWDAVATPGRSWSDTVTYGDVANTAGLVSLPAVAGKYDPAVANMGLRDRYAFQLRQASGGKDPKRIKLTPERIDAAKEWMPGGGKRNEYIFGTTDPEKIAAIKSSMAKPTQQMSDAQEFARAAVRAGEDVRFKMPDGPGGSLYVRVGNKGTARFSNHPQPTDWVGDEKVPVGGFSQSLGRRHQPATVSVDPASGTTLQNALEQFGLAETPPRIRAYHGSPHDFDRFDLSKIGTGEGAQAYGHGLYFAEAEDVAKEYRKALARSNELTKNPTFGGMSIGAYRTRMELAGDDGAAEAAQQLRDFILTEPGVRSGLQYDGKTLDDVVPDLRRRLISQKAQAPETLAEWYDNVISGLDRALRDIDRPDYRAGRMYEVDINADPADFLDWDAPLREQPRVAEKLGFSARTADDINAEAEAIMAAQPNGAWLNDPAAKARVDALQEELDRLPPRTDGANYYRQTDPDNYLHSVLRDGNSIADRTDELRKAGIPGIKYYDRGSRAGKEGTRNYVVFDDSLIEILRKYGLAGAAPLGAILGTQDDEKQRIRDFLSQ